MRRMHSAHIYLLLCLAAILLKYFITGKVIVKAVRDASRCFGQRVPMAAMYLVITCCIISSRLRGTTESCSEVLVILCENIRSYHGASQQACYCKHRYNMAHIKIRTHIGQAQWFRVLRIPCQWSSTTRLWEELQHFACTISKTR